MGELDGKIAVITGGGSGIGLGIAERFAGAGAEVVIVGRSKERLDEAVAQIGHGARGVATDVGDEDQVRALFDGLDRVDILVTCAGGAVFGKIEELPPSEWRRLFHARFFGQISCCHFAVPKMPEGSVILLCSGIAADAHVNDYAGGAALCGAVNGMGKSLAVDLGPRGIRVNVLSPGFIWGTVINTNLEGDEVKDFVETSIAAIPLGRPGLPKDLGDAAFYLATNDYVNGQVIDIDGGWTAT
jgi:NAD(P)-dependent dehydrogenase (short-subunit alcohol dehydrogenase family)